MLRNWVNQRLIYLLSTLWFCYFISFSIQELIVMDDTVLESHTENPALVQMVFLDDGKLLFTCFVLRMGGKAVGPVYCV